MKSVNFAAVLVPLLLTAAGASARDLDTEPTYGFGHAGELALSSDAALIIQHSSEDVTTLQLSPAADYFVIDRLSVGGFISLDYTKSGRSDGSRFGIGPRVGYNFGLSDTFSIWPKAGLAYTHSSTSTTVAETDTMTTETSRDGDALALNLFVPFMVHPVKHFFAGFGPFLDADLSGKNRVTVVGAKLTLGGWLYM
jgi:opacity protein-like surface antigen